MSLRSEGRLVSVTEHDVTVPRHTVAVSRPYKHTHRSYVVFNIDLHVYVLCTLQVSCTSAVMIVRYPAGRARCHAGKVWPRLQ